MQFMHHLKLKALALSKYVDAMLNHYGLHHTILFHILYSVLHAIIIALLAEHASPKHCVTTYVYYCTDIV